MIDQFQAIGRDLFLAGLNNSHSGNMSIRQGDKLVITRSGSPLGRLAADDLVETGIFEDDENTKRASSELPVHRAIYIGTGAGAICHAHPPYAIAFSLLRKTIVPIDAEGLYLTKEIPVVQLAPEKSICGAQELIEALVPVLQQSPLAMVKGHGAFAIGDTLEQAYHGLASMEHSCKIMYLAETLQGR